MSTTSRSTSLREAVERQPYPDFQAWWPLGERFVVLMARAIVAEWDAIGINNPGRVAALVDEYTGLVYGRASRTSLVDDFVGGRGLGNFQSGEFDALSYAFYRDAFDGLAESTEAAGLLPQASRDFTRRVGQRFFAQMAEHLALALPKQLTSSEDFLQLQQALDRVGGFLMAQGYLRDHFAFHFDVTVHRGEQQIRQHVSDFLPALADGTAYALYEMGYPIILPSAVYLYQTMGEAQHHSSRTIEELFARCGCIASETDDFDPTGFPSELVVELWEIRRQSTSTADDISELPLAA